MGIHRNEITIKVKAQPLMMNCVWKSVIIGLMSTRVQYRMSTVAECQCKLTVVVGQHDHLIVNLPMTCCYLGDNLLTVASNGLISGVDLVMHILGHFEVALKINSCLEALLLELEIIKYHLL